MRALLATAVLVALASSASGTHLCSGPPLVDARLAYVAFDNPQGCDCTWSTWVYTESNGVEGLQRGGESLFGDRDICQDSENPDTLIF